MKNYATLLIMLAFTTASASAQEVGIDFAAMQLGTKLTTLSVSPPQETYIEEYLGQEDGFFMVQNSKLLDDGSTDLRNKDGYDAKGRKVFSMVEGKKNTYTPYSCHYVIGKCTHTHKYFNRFTKKYVSNQDKFDNRLDGDTLYVGVITFDGSKYEVPFKLGKHKLRVSNEYKNALGQPTGYKFVDLIIP